jgi:hypothetical protein
MLSRSAFDFSSTPTYLDPFLEPAPSPNGWLDLPPPLPPRDAIALALKYARTGSPIANALFSPYPPQPPFDDPLRAAAWERTAGHIDAPACVDEELATLHRNARSGELGASRARKLPD